ncbi:MAG TPA: amidoligase family protein [Kiloniellales bacterium]|nr:amidoligase family protein [Kiloniellales bacterium]
MLHPPANAGQRRFILPPITERADGQPRRVGVELEFVALAAREAAELTQHLFGGTLVEVSPFYFVLRDSRLGDFRVELDSRHALKQPRYAEPAPDADWFDSLVDDLERELQYLYSVAVSGILPLEIVTPPIPLRALAALDPLVDALKLRGARGTEESLLYAFGVHLNPEAVAVERGYILDVLRAYLLLEDWLRREVSPDLLRRALAFITPFGKGYARLVLDPDYDEARLVDDYLAANPTRYRSLDLLPLLAELDEAQVRARVSDRKVNRRPTFHYRLPDFRTTDPDWSLAGEWNRWVEVEKLAAEPATLRELSLAYLEHDDRRHGDWADRIAARLGL